MIKAILLIAGLGLYIMIGSLIGLFTDDTDMSWVILMAAFWPVAILLWTPIKCAIFIYEKIRRKKL